MFSLFQKKSALPSIQNPSARSQSSYMVDHKYMDIDTFYLDDTHPCKKQINCTISVDYLLKTVLWMG